jgi:signal recognition particle subunit SRP54
MLKQGEAQLKRIEAMIGSMTQQERENPDLLASQPSRRRRIAKGSGHEPADVDKVLADFQRMRGFMQQMSSGGGMPGMGMPGMGGGMPGMGMPGMGGGMPGMPGMGMPGMGGGKPPKRAKPAKKRKGFGQL